MRENNCSQRGTLSEARSAWYATGTAARGELGAVVGVGRLGRLGREKESGHLVAVPGDGRSAFGGSELRVLGDAG